MNNNYLTINRFVLGKICNVLERFLGGSKKVVRKTYKNMRFVKSFDKTTDKKFSHNVSLYSTNTNKDVIVRSLSFKFKNLKYQQIHNEIAILRLLQKLCNGERKVKDVKLPRIQKVISNNHSITVFREFINGTPLGMVSTEMKITALQQCLKAFATMNANLSVNERKALPKRTQATMSILFPSYLLKGIIRDPKHAHVYIKLSFSYYVLFFLQVIHNDQREYVLSHRDLHANNVLVAENQIYIIDPEITVLAEQTTDLAIISRYYLEQLGETNILELVKKEIRSSKDLRSFKKLALFYTMQTIATEDVRRPFYGEALAYALFASKEILRLGNKAEKRLETKRDKRVNTTQLLAKLKSPIGVTLFIVFCTIILGMTIRGIAGNPTEQTINQTMWKDDGPLELSPDRGRFALTYSVVENKSLSFSLPVARFATPDLGYKNGKYVSLFAPAVSYILIPGYIVGKYFNLAQVGAFASIAFFALLNALLIRGIAIKLGAKPLAATIGAATFLFATPAFPYAVSLYQHHISTFLILSSIYLLVRYKSLWSLAIIWFLFAASLPVDNPNLFLMAPIAIMACFKMISFAAIKDKIVVSLKPLGILTFFAAVVPLALFAWFNNASYGSPLQLGGTVSNVKAIDANGKPAAPPTLSAKNAAAFLDPEKQKKSAVHFFNTRNLINGMYEHVLSRDRGMFWFTPVMFVGIVGFVLLYKRNGSIAGVFIAIAAIDLLLYSMWGDPYGGWAFGSRYMIPSYAILSIGIGIVLSAWRRKIWFLIVFLPILVYSILVNSVGALTTNSNPPKAEVLSLEKLSHQQEKYSYDRNITILQVGKSKSFIWQTYLQDRLPAVTYFWIISGSIVLVQTLSLSMLAIASRKENA